jgi:hypothetical protein
MKYILARLKEPSTFVGLTALLSVAGVTLEPQFTAAIVTVGTTVAGMLLALLPDGSGQRGGE